MRLTRKQLNICVICLAFLCLSLVFVATFVNFAQAETSTLFGSSASNWTLADQQNYGSSVTDDTNFYHSGESSVKFLRKSLHGNATLTAKTSVAVAANTMYESIVWVKSRNADAGTEFNFNLVGNDASQTVLRGITQVLNTSGNLSLWTKVYTRVLIPTGITQVTPQIVVTNGSAELWFDSIEINQIDVALVDQVTHFAQDSDGNHNGFVATGGKHVRTLNQLTNGDAYVVSSNAATNAATLTFFDVFGNEISHQNVTENSHLFVAPSCYYAELSFNNLPTAYTLTKVYDANMIETSKYWSNNDFKTTFSQSQSGVAFEYQGNDSYLFYDGASSNNVYFTAGKTYNMSVWVKLTSTDTAARFSSYFKDQANTAVYFKNFHLQNSDGSFTDKTDGSTSAIAGGSERWAYGKWVKVSTTYTPTASFSPQFIFRLHSGNGHVVVEDFCISEVDTAYQTQVESLLAQNTLWTGSTNGQVSVSNANQKATAGSTYTFDIAFTPKTNASIGNLRANVYLGSQKISATDILLPQGANVSNLVANQRVNLQGCSITLPNWLPTNTYTITLGTPFVGEPTLQTVQVEQSGYNLVASVSNSTIYVDGNAVAPMLYLGIDSYSSFESKPDKSFLKQSNTLDTISQSGITLYSTFTGNLAGMWKQDGSIDYTQFDKDIYEMLCATSDAKVMVNIGLYAPDWWLTANPNEQTVVYTSSSASKQNGTVSFASTKFRQDAGAVVQQILEHMQTQPYYNAVFAIKLSAGGTNEWQYQGFADTSVGDYSACSLAAFQAYCQATYSTISSLNSAWSTSYASFSNVALPTYDEIYTNTNTLNTNRKVVDYNLFVNNAVVDTFLHFAQIAKTATNNTKIVGGYGAYMWVHETAPIGFAGTSAQRLYSSPYVDFLSSPLTYHERYLGMDSTYMGLNDAIRAYGKIYLLEQDSRTSLRTDFGNVWTMADNQSSGQYFNLQDTISQLKRDFANNFVNGSGFWMYDMENGWYDDPSIYQLLNSTKNLYDGSLQQNVNYTNQVAVIVDDQLYAYTARKSSYYGNQLYLNLYRLQRQSLAFMGAGYDVYAMSTLAEGKVPNHKVYIFLAPTEFSQSEIDAINNLKQNGNYLVFVSMVGNNVSNMKQATGLTMAQITSNSTAMQVEITNSSIAQGKRYGAEKAGYAPITYVNDSSATKWGNVVGKTYNGLAYKNNSTWHCVYSAAPNLPTALLRHILAEAGVHVYSQDLGDVVHSNSGYLSVYSQNGGQKTLSLDGYYQVTDAYSGSVISSRTNTINYLHRANDTRVFRLTPVGDVQVDLSINGTTQTKWCNAGDTIQLNAPTVEGMRFVGWMVNGQIVSQNSNYAHIVGETAQTISAEYILQCTLTVVDGSTTTQTVCDLGSTVTLVANVPTGYYFASWQVDGADVSTQATYVHTVTKDQTIVATYTQQQFDVTWVVNGATTTQTYAYGIVPTFGGSTHKPSDNVYHYAFNGWDKPLVAVTQPVTYTAQYTQTFVDYTITFVNYDDSVIQTQTKHWGDEVTPPANPTRPSTAQHTYRFSGWNTAVTAVNGNATYRATYSQSVNQYLVQFVDEDGTVLQTQTLDYGSTPIFGGSTPTKPSTAQHSYSFSGWTPQVEQVTQNATYTATFSATINKYTVQFLDEDGTVLQTQTQDYGATPIFGGATPTKQGTAQHSYAFSGWTPQVAQVTQNATYTATFSTTINKYTIQFLGEDGTVLQTQTLDYGSTPIFGGATPQKSADTYFTYQFNGWAPQIAQVTQNATYTATFLSTPKTVLVTWIADGQSVAEQVNVGSTVAQKTAQKDGYTFQGWYFGETLFDFATPLMHDVTLTAKFTPIEQQSPLITVTWVFDGKMETELFERGKPIASKKVTKQGYQLDCWLYDGSPFDFATVVNSDITLTAQFSPLPQTTPQPVVGCKGSVGAASIAILAVVATATLAVIAFARRKKAQK